MSWAWPTTPKSTTPNKNDSWIKIWIVGHFYCKIFFFLCVVRWHWLFFLPPLYTDLFAVLLFESLCAEFVLFLLFLADTPSDLWAASCCCRCFRADLLTCVSVHRGMSAVCVYTIEDIDRVFMNSPLEASSSDFDRPRKVQCMSWLSVSELSQLMCNQNQNTMLFFLQCVEDSTKTDPRTIRMIDHFSDMKDWIEPVHKSGPLLLNHHIYSHIYADGSQSMQNSDHTVLFLALSE